MVMVGHFLAAASTAWLVTSNSTPPGRQAEPQPLATVTVDRRLTQVG